MSKEKGDWPRPQLRLVVNNLGKPGKESPPAAQPLLFAELVVNRDALRTDFYAGMDRQMAKACQIIERCLIAHDWEYGLDPQPGRPLVVQVGEVLPRVQEFGAAFDDEVLIFVSEDPSNTGLTLTLESLLPFYDEDAAVMEDAVLFAPIMPYGTLFLEENQADGCLDLLYRVSFPVYPPVVSARLVDRLTAVAEFELVEILLGITENAATE